MKPFYFLQYNDIHKNALKIASHFKKKKIDYLIGVGRGGLLPATIVGYQLNLPVYNFGTQSYTEQKQGKIGVYQDFEFTNLNKKKTILVIDDLVDSSQTLTYCRDHFSWAVKKMYFASLYIKEPDVKPDYFAEKLSADKWIVFPYEKESLLI